MVGDVIYTMGADETGEQVIALKPPMAQKSGPHRSANDWKTAGVMALGRLQLFEWTRGCHWRQRGRCLRQRG